MQQLPLLRVWLQIHPHPLFFAILEIRWPLLLRLLLLFQLRRSNHLVTNSFT
jgi:hypothetical protein